MTKSRSFSIYLLRENWNAGNALSDESKLALANQPAVVPEGSTLYILDADPRAPWWKEYFGVQENLKQSLKGAMLFVGVGTNVFALTFGHVAHYLKDEAYEYDFGLRVTLNSLDPSKLRSTDTVQPGSAQRRRTQLPKESDLTFLDFDRDSTILKSLTGKVRPELKPIFSQATGSSNLKISAPVEPAGLTGLLTKLLELYKKEDFKTNFPDILNITPVREPWKKSVLDDTLLTALQGRDPSLVLSVPEIIDFRDDLNVGFSGYGKSLVYDDIYIDRLYEYLDAHKVDPATLTLKNFRSISLILMNEAQVATSRHGL